MAGKQRSTHYYQVIGVVAPKGRTMFRAFGRFSNVPEMRDAAERWAEQTPDVVGYIMKRRRWHEMSHGCEVRHGR